MLADQRMHVTFRMTFRHRGRLGHGPTVTLMGFGVPFALAFDLGDGPVVGDLVPVVGETARGIDTAEPERVRGQQSMTARISANEAARSPSWALTTRLTRFPILDKSRLVGSVVVNDSFERTEARWSITVAASESPPGVVLFPSSMPGRFPLAGSSPVGREG